LGVVGCLLAICASRYEWCILCSLDKGNVTSPGILTACGSGSAATLRTFHSTMLYNFCTLGVRQLTPSRALITFYLGRFPTRQYPLYKP
uniref:Secreted protein n=1 Tax=Haemonchus placei TaxID=6290 RepID=A0A158QL93_HAEPC